MFQLCLIFQEIFGSVIKYSPELKVKEAQKNKKADVAQDNQNNTDSVVNIDDDSDEATFLESLKLNRN